MAIPTILYLSGARDLPSLHQVEDQLTQAGYLVRSIRPPDHPVDQQGSDQHLRRCVATMIYADAVALLPGWEQSRYAQVERDLASKVGLQVALLEQWLDPQLSGKPEN